MFLYIALIEVFPDLSTIIDRGALDGERSAMVTDPSRFQVSFKFLAALDTTLRDGNVLKYPVPRVCA